MIPYYYIPVLSIITDKRSWNGLMNVIAIQENLVLRP
jgi:hypothetical protein